MSNTKILVFSRDRAMQLDATLHSFFLRCKDAASTDIVVLFRASSALHEAQYSQLQKDYLGRVRFVAETHFRRQVLNELAVMSPMRVQERLYFLITRVSHYFAYFLPPPSISSRTKDHNHVLFLVDDNIFIRDFSISDILHSMEACRTALGFSLRLGENTTYCYSLDVPQDVPTFEKVRNDICRYLWTSASADFGYPLELSSSVYRINEILPLFASIPFRNPNTLEGSIAAQARSFANSHPDLLCFRRSVAFCVPVNRVQDTMKNRAGENIHLSSEKLAELFSSGKRIDVQSLFGFTPNACHQEVEFSFETRYL